MLRAFRSLPFALQLVALAALAMLFPATLAVWREEFAIARSFSYSAILTLALLALVALAVANRPERDTVRRQLLTLFGAYALLPLLFAIPFQDAAGDTRFLNAYVEMMASFTTTGSTLYHAPGRLDPILHLWRAEVGWLGGFLIWVAAGAILAPLQLGGFEITARDRRQRATGPVRGGRSLIEEAAAADRLRRSARALAPVYLGLTGLLWVILLMLGHTTLGGLIKAMGVVSSSGISLPTGAAGDPAGRAGEVVILCFFVFALSRATFSRQTALGYRPRPDRDPELRLAAILVFGTTALLMVRHWLGAWEVADAQNAPAALSALWGSLFTLASFLSTTGIVSTDWAAAQAWSGLGTPGLLLMGLAIMGGGVATAAGGVKLLRVYALYLQGRRELERLVHPSSIGRASMQRRHMRTRGAFIAFVFFMMFALMLAAFTMAFAAEGQPIEGALLLAISALTTTGPLLTVAAEVPVRLIELGDGLKLTYCAGMVLGRLELLAIIALITPALWRE